MRQIFFFLIVSFFFLILSLPYVFGLTSFPLIRTQLFNGLGDELLGLWIVDKISENFFSNPSQLFNGGVFFPETNTLAFAENLFLPALVYRALFALCKNALLSFHGMILVFFSLNFWSFFLLVRLFFKRKAALFGGVVFSLSMLRMAQLAHIQLLPQCFFPLAFLMLYRFKDSQKNGYLYLFFLVLIGQFLSSVYLAVILSVTALPFFVFYFFSEAKRSQWIALMVGGLATALVLWAFFEPYFEVSKIHNLQRSLEEARIYGAKIQHYLSAAPNNFLWQFVSPLFQGGQMHEKHLFLGFVVLGLCLIASLNKLRWPVSEEKFWKRVYWCTLLLVVWLSLGPSAQLYELFYYFFPGFKAIRVPARFGFAVLFLVSLGAARGFDSLIDRQKGQIIGMSTFLLFLLENYTRIPFVEIPTQLKNVSQHLKGIKNNAAVVFLPIQEVHWETTRMWQSRVHTHAIVNGYSGLEPEFYLNVKQIQHSLELLMPLLSQTGVRYLVLERNHFHSLNQTFDMQNWINQLGPPVFEDAFCSLFDLDKGLKN